MHDLGLDVAVDEIGNVVGTRAGTDPGAGAGDDRQPHRHRAHRRPLRRQPRRAGRAGGGRDARAPRRAHPPPDRRRLLHQRGGRPLPARHARQPRVRRRAGRWRRRSTSPPSTAPTVGAELARIGYAGPVPCPSAVAPHAFVELHIEQGPVLEAAGIGIGAVTGVQGISWQELTIDGQSQPRRHHADGDAPRRRLRRRRDHRRSCGALAPSWAAHQVGTVGRIELQPNLVNVVAGRATLTVDLRNTDDAGAAGGRGAAASRRPTTWPTPRACASTSRVARPLRAGGVRPARGRPGRGDRRGASVYTMPAAPGRRRPRRPDAGAGLPDGDDLHAERRRRVSHNPAEHTDPADLAAGADVLLQVLLVTRPDVLSRETGLSTGCAASVHPVTNAFDGATSADAACR